MKFSIIIPAHNEALYIGTCLASIQKAAEPFSEQVETIVVLNRCTDQTEEIARSYGVRITCDDSKNLARIRNHGAHIAKGEILVTIDADSTMSSNLLVEINSALKTGTCIGGGVMFYLDRMSLGIICTFLLFLPMVLWYRVSAGSFWLFRKDFLKLGGFDENRYSFEDIDFAKRLKAYGKKQGKRFKILTSAHIRTSSRKFDRLGDWYLVKRPFLVFSLLRGYNRSAADHLWYDS